MVDIVNLSNGFHTKTGVLWEIKLAMHRLLKLAYFYTTLWYYCHIFFLFWLQGMHLKKDKLGWAQGAEFSILIYSHKDTVPITESP